MKYIQKGKPKYMLNLIDKMSNTVVATVPYIFIYLLHYQKQLIFKRNVILNLTIIRGSSII